MPQIKFYSHDGSIHEVEAESGISVMQAAVDNMIDGIVGECGGACSCATCHIYVKEGWADRLPPAHEMEQDMLECVLEPRPTSRLSCQITLTDELDGLEVEMPESQF